MIVYSASCPEGRSYIGITRGTLECRRRQHLQASVAGSSCKFHEALRYWGDRMTWRVIDRCKSIPELRQKERYYIASFDSYANGYNNTEGGEYSDLYQGQRVEDDGTVVQLFAPSEKGRNAGRNVTVEITPERSNKELSEADIVARVDKKIERADNQRNDRLAKRAAKKAATKEWKRHG